MNDQKAVGPDVRVFLVCDYVLQDKAGKWSAIGIFSGIMARKYPSWHSSLGLFIRLTGAFGEYDVRVDFREPEPDGRVLATFDGIRLNVKDRLAIVDFGITTRNLPVPRPGQYQFVLYLNNEFTHLCSVVATEIE